MTKKNIGYPFQYGDELTPEMASNNRKQAVSYSVLIPSIWWHNLGFGEPIQSYSSCLNESKTPIVRIVETFRVNSISCGGNLGKSGPGPRAKADALKNARKTGGGSIFAQGFTPQRQYCSRPINKPLSCRNNGKINQDQFNGNQNPVRSSSSMEKMSKRLSQEYREYQQKFNSPPVSKRFDTKNYDQEKFKELAKDPRANKEVFHKTTLDEARTALQSEMEGIVDNPQRIEKPICKFVDLDFKVNGPGPYTHMDVKHPVGSENVLHIIDLAYVPSHEKEIFKEYCLKGAGSSEGIKFLNDNDK